MCTSQANCRWAMVASRLHEGKEEKAFCSDGIVLFLWSNTLPVYSWIGLFSLVTFHFPNCQRPTKDHIYICKLDISYCVGPWKCHSLMVYRFTLLLARTNIWPAPSVVLIGQTVATYIYNWLTSFPESLQGLPGCSYITTKREETHPCEMSVGISPQSHMVSKTLAIIICFRSRWS